MSTTSDLYTRQEAKSSVLPPELSNAFLLSRTDANYTHQYANFYFIRLVALRKALMDRAKQKWLGSEGNPTFVPRVLDVSRGTLCWVIGTVYMEMPLKENVLHDLANDHGIAAPRPRLKFHSTDDQILLEDESGRINIMGDVLKDANITTGLVMAVLGLETASGDFQVVDFCFAGAPPQKAYVPANDSTSMQLDSPNEWIALVSGLNVGPPSAASDLRVNLLVEYLLSEAGDQKDQANASAISRLIIAGDTFAPVERYDPDAPQNDMISAPDTGMDMKAKKAQKRYGYEAAAFSPHASQAVSGHISELSRAMVVHLLPGAGDPAGVIMPQQPLPRAMFGNARNYESFRTETNPCWIGVESCDILGTGGQNIDDIFRYIKSSDRLAVTCDTLKWRHLAPTAPDTLWCFPYFSSDPFVLTRTPHIYFVGNQPRFETTVLEQEDGQRTRVILLPKFSETGQLVLVNPHTLEVKLVRTDSGWEDS